MQKVYQKGWTPTPASEKKKIEKALKGLKKINTCVKVQGLVFWDPVWSVTYPPHNKLCVRTWVRL